MTTPTLFTMCNTLPSQRRSILHFAWTGGPGLPWGGPAEVSMNLDLSFYSWDLISKFVLKGFYFSVFLTVVATLGGIAFGTILALMRLW